MFVNQSDVLKDLLKNHCFNQSDVLKDVTNQMF